MNVKVTDTDRGARKIIINLGIGAGATATLPKKSHLSVGVHAEAGSETYANGATIAQVAAQHEFGEGVPQRSWLRGWFDNRSLAIFKHELSTAVREALLGDRPLMVGLGELGEVYVHEIQARIDAGLQPALTPETVRKKESLDAPFPDVPLEDTLRFLHAIEEKHSAK